MRDRVSTKILDNGATRYGVYDETGKLLRYEYIKLEDEPDEEGTVLNKANLLADETAALLGLGQNDPTVNDALNVLANIGNVNVWSRTITLTESTYKPVVGVDNYSVTLDSGDKLYYSDSVDIASLQDINLASPVSTFSFTGGNFPSVVGKYFRKNNEATIYIYPASDQSIAGSTLWLRGCHVISAAVDIPAGTTTDYLTSTDRDAYPDQSAEGGQDAYYTLGDVVSNYDLGQSGSNILVTYSSDIVVSYDGVVTMVEPNSLSMVNIDTDVASTFSGKFVKTSINDSVVFIPVDATASYDNSSGFSHVILSKYQPVTGHAAIPANTTITYLGQLGGGARIEVGSYVGAGTYGASNPCSITAPFKIKAVGIISVCNGNNEMLSINDALGQFWLSALQLTTSYKSHCGLVHGDNDFFNSYAKKSADGKTVYWYNIRSAAVQLNYSGDIHYYIAIG